MAPKTRLEKIRKLENKKIRKLAFELWRLNLDYSKFKNFMSQNAPFMEGQQTQNNKHNYS